MEDQDSSQMAASPASFITLPEELILHIFSFLPPEDLMFGVRGTCLRFYDLSQSSDLWRYVSVTRISAVTPVELQRRGSGYSSQSFYRNLLQQDCIRSSYLGHNTLPVTMLIRSVEERGDIWPSCSVTGSVNYSNLQSLTLIRKALPSVEVWAKLPALKHLHLSTCLFHENGQNSRGQIVIDLFKNIKNITELQSLTLRFSCSRCTNKMPTVAELSDIQASMKDYFLTCPKLRQLQLDSFVNDDVFKSILTHCSQLKAIAVRYLGLTPEGFITAVSDNSKLSLSSLVIKNYASALNDECLKALSLHHPNIRRLALGLTDDVTNDGLELFLKKCSQLTHLALGTLRGHKMISKTNEFLQNLILFGISFASVTVFRNLCESSQNLREIQLVSCDNTDIITMVNICPLLEKVTLRKCSHVNSTEVVYLMKNLPHLQEFVCHLAYPQLFELEQLSPSRKRTRAGGFVLENQPRTHRKFYSVELHTCQELTPLGVSSLAYLCSNLRRLTINTVNGVNDYTVKAILRSFPNLQYLRLERSGATDRQNQLTGACLRYVQNWGTCLQSLKLMALYRFFTVAALVKLLAGSSTLVECVVPHHTLKSPGRPDEEVTQEVTVQMARIAGEKKLAMPSIFAVTSDNVQLKLLGVRTCQG